MKIAVVALFATAWSTYAETNTITFTNRNGVVSNAEPIRVEHSKLLYKLSNGSGGTIGLSELPVELQKRFGYEPAKAHEDELEEAQRKARQAEIARIQILEKQVENRRELIYAHVVEVLENQKLLVEASEKGTGWYDITPEFREIQAKVGKDVSRVPRASGTIMLIDYPRFENVADDDNFVTVGYFIGTYEYTTDLGRKKRVREYTCSLVHAISYALHDQSLSR